MQAVIKLLCVTLLPILLITLACTNLEKVSGIETWIPVLKLQDDEVPQKLLSFANSRHLYVQMETGALYSLWSDGEGAYPTHWRKEETTPTFKDDWGHCKNIRLEQLAFKIDEPPEESLQSVHCSHVILHSAVNCESIFTLSKQRHLFAWSQCEGPFVYYLFDYYLPRLSNARCLQKGESKC